MGQWIELDTACTAAGDRLVLRHRSGEYEIRCNGWDLMSNRAHHSEDVMGRTACTGLGAAAPRVLIGGLGMGYMLRAALGALPDAARIVVAERVPEVLAWNRGPLGALAGRPLDDPRVTVRCEDVAALLCDPGAAWHAVLLDTDNGPEAVMLDGNASLYTVEGLQRIRAALTPDGRLAVWSADRSAWFEANLAAAGLAWRCAHVTARGDTRDPCHALYFCAAVAGCLPDRVRA